MTSLQIIETAGTFLKDRQPILKTQSKGILFPCLTAMLCPMYLYYHATALKSIA